jgi:hypothetical protein
LQARQEAGAWSYTNGRMYPVALGVPFVVQEKTLDANFTGAVEYARAKCTIGPGGSQIRASAKILGAGPNGYRLSLINTGVTTATTTVTQVGADFEVRLRRSSTVVLATPQEVAGVINAANLPIRCAWSGTSPMTQALLQAFTGGADPTRRDPTGTRFEWDRATTQLGGFFYFGNLDHSVIISGIELAFTGLSVSPIPFSVERVNLDDGLEPVSASAMPILVGEVSSALPTFAVNGIDGIILPPYQALLVKCAALGRCYITAQRLMRHPYA